MKTSSAYSVSSADGDLSSWPEPLHEDAYFGLAGEFVKTIEPHTEADPAALLFQFHVAFGNVIGRKSYFQIEADRHYTNLFTVIVGQTAKARKGTSWGHVRRLFQAVDERWTESRIQSGLSSGEGLIWAVRDPIPQDNDHGVSDKRLLAIEGEFASPLKVLSRSGNTLSPTIRNAWDDGHLRILTKNSAAAVKSAHISIIGHISQTELLRYLESTEMANGFGNRILWVCAKRSKCLPEGGNVSEKDLVTTEEKVREAVRWSHTWDLIKFDDPARKLWHERYPALSEGKSGLLGAMVARAESQVLRLAVSYSLLDLRYEIGEEHLQAALAVWDYSEASCRYIFGRRTGDPDADKNLDLLKSRPEGQSRTDINRGLGGHTSSERIDSALDTLEAFGLARKAVRNTGGRPLEVWQLPTLAEETEEEEKL